LLLFSSFLLHLVHLMANQVSPIWDNSDGTPLHRNGGCVCSPVFSRLCEGPSSPFLALPRPSRPLNVDASRSRYATLFILRFEEEPLPRFPQEIGGFVAISSGACAFNAHLLRNNLTPSELRNASVRFNSALGVASSFWRTLQGMSRI